MSSETHLPMFTHDIIASIRFISRHKAFTAINITGLTIGILSCLLIILYINSELTFDRFHKNWKNIYRVVMHQPGNLVVGSSSDWWVVSPAILKPTWENDLPEVDLITRTISKRWNFKLEDQYINEEVLIVDPEFFEIFSFPLKAGDRGKALRDPYSIVLTESMARKYFGEDDPIGRAMVLNDGRLLTVTGILEAIPGNSHLQFDFLSSLGTLESILGRSLLSENWLHNSYRTYLTLNENTDLELLDAKLNRFFYRMIVDYDFLDLYGIKLESGRNFSRDMGTDNGNAYIINKAAAKRMDFQSPVGSKFGFDGNLGTVVGLTEDFYFESLHKPITPLGIGVLDEYYWSFVSIKVNNTNHNKTLEYIEDTWKNYVPGIPMEFSFFDEHMDQLYSKDRQLSRSMNYLAIMALFISCLGIFGLMSLSLKEKTREISLRKVMGASYAKLLSLLTRDSVFIILISTIFGGVLGWYLSTEWLNNFAYRCRFGFDVILISALLAVLMYILMISFKLFKSITTNPAESLRME